MQHQGNPGTLTLTLVPRQQGIDNLADVAANGGEEETVIVQSDARVVSEVAHKVYIAVARDILAGKVAVFPQRSVFVEAFERVCEEDNTPQWANNFNVDTPFTANVNKRSSQGSQSLQITKKTAVFALAASKLTLFKSEFFKAVLDVVKDFITSAKLASESGDGYYRVSVGAAKLIAVKLELESQEVDLISKASTSRKESVEDSVQFLPFENYVRVYFEEKDGVVNIPNR